MRAIIYLRVSTHEQKELGFSLEKQRKMCEVKAKQLGISRKLIFSDALSGKMGMWDRPGLVDALHETQKGDVFIVLNRERLARDTDAMSEIEDTIHKAKAKLVFVVDEQNIESKKNSLLLATVSDIFAEYELLIMNMRAKNVVDELKSQNRCVGNVQFGFQKAADGKHLEPCEKEQAVIKLVKKLHKNSHCPADITKKVNARGHKNRNGNPIQSTQIKRIIKAL